MSQRTNQEWLDELRGDRGQSQQRLAYEDLSRYLYVVAYNYLRTRQANLASLAGFALEELAALAQDFVQETLEKLARNDHALLNQFDERGRFTAWTAQIVRRQAGQEFRRPYWTRREPLPEEEHPEPDTAEWPPSFKLTALIDPSNPENTAILQQVAETLQDCFNKLPERRRLAFWGCEVEERSAEFVAKTLGATENAVYLLVYRAKRGLRRCLREAGLDQDVLKLFAKT